MIRRLGVAVLFMAAMLALPSAIGPSPLVRHLNTVPTVATSPAAPAPARLQAPLPPGWVGLTDGVAGRVHVSNGETIYEDYIYDDYGADSYPGPRLVSGESRFKLTHPNGDYIYPTDPSFGQNAADLLELRFAKRNGELQVLARMNTLLPRDPSTTVTDTTVVAVAIGGTSGPSMPWPFHANLSTPGTEHVLTFWGTGAAWDTTPLDQLGGSFAVDTDLNTLTASVPMSLVGSDTFRAYAASGVWDHVNGQWAQVLSGKQPTQWQPAGAAPGSTNVPAAFNVAFRPAESGTWLDANQSAALAKGDISAFYSDINLDAPDTTGPLPTGYYERVFRSSIPLGSPAEHEGVTDSGVPGRGQGDYQGTTLVNFLGYDHMAMVYVPHSGYNDVLLALHGGGDNAEGQVHIANFQTFFGEGAVSATIAGTHAVLISPDPGGPNNQYTDAAEQVALEAVADTRAVYGIDPSRGALLEGHSMGGFGVLRLAVTHPDYFRAVIAVDANVGNSNDDADPGTATTGVSSNPLGGNGDPQDLFANLRDTPIMFMHGVEDELEPYAYAYLADQKVAGLGYAERLESFPQSDHIAAVTLGQFQEAAQFAAALGPRPVPAHVTFSMSQAWWRADLSPDLVFDHAWWVQGLRLRQTGSGAADPSFSAIGKVDATSYALGGVEPAVVPFGPRPSSPLVALMPAVVQGQDYDWSTPPATPLPASNGFAANLTDVGSASFDLAGMAIDTYQPVAGSITTDGPTDLLLAGQFPSTPHVTGAPATVSKDGVVLHLPAGTSTIVVTVDARLPPTTVTGGTSSP
ncbi:MAG TPA: prolyl oligopeptidase family serine peptidase [Acidimicrobiales bacterium]|nr:prolyl oligopeptidase family serine peptidase [Acidimicrobiales bacterium]